MKHLFYIVCLMCLLAGCSFSASEEKMERAPSIWPDYTETVVPYNIAPLNFSILEKASRYRMVIYSDTEEKIILKSRSPHIRIPLRAWKKMLTAHAGHPLYFEIHTCQNGQWTKYNPIQNQIAKEPIDPYLTYRLIEPGYVGYGDLSIVERNLESFETRVLVSNQRDIENNQDFCINCHTPRNYKSDYTLFHVRGTLGGTVICSPKGIEKLNTKTDSTFSSAVYPAWHPQLHKIAFSSNTTGQLLHSADIQKVEVFDSRSDLLLYDVNSHALSHICKTPNQLETFPTWSPDGQYLYYCCAQVPPEDTLNTLQSSTDQYRLILYDLVRRSYNTINNTFGPEEIVVKASSSSLSITFPRLSPDGQRLLFCISDYGTFSIWHKKSDLYMIDFGSGALKNLENANSKESESYHTWSSNSRWIVVSSRRDDGNYTRPYLAYIDEEGNDYKAFVLPQRDPEYYTFFLKSFNVPEFMIEPSSYARRAYDEVIHHETHSVSYQ